MKSLLRKKPYFAGAKRNPEASGKLLQNLIIAILSKSL